jgi:hypothetical protein
MAAAKKTAEPAVVEADDPVVDEVEAPKKSRWAKMRDEARAKHKPIEPYEFDGTEPPTLISSPDSVERLTALTEMIDGQGSFDFANLRPMFKALCGESFDAVWVVVKDEPADVLLPLFEDIWGHFNGQTGARAGDDLPGGS